MINVRNNIKSSYRNKICQRIGNLKNSVIGECIYTVWKRFSAIGEGVNKLLTDKVNKLLTVNRVGLSTDTKPRNLIIINLLRNGNEGGGFIYDLR